MSEHRAEIYGPVEQIGEPFDPPHYTAARGEARRPAHVGARGRQQVLAGEPGPVAMTTTLPCNVGIVD